MESKSYQKQNQLQATDWFHINSTHFGRTCSTVCKHKSQRTLNHSDIFYSSLWLDTGTRALARIPCCPKSHKYILSPSIFGKCLSVHVFLTFSNLGMAHESVHMTTSLITVVLPCNEDILPETAGASQILSCREAMVGFFHPTGCSSPLWGPCKGKQI